MTMWRKLRLLILTFVLTALPGTALALGEAKDEPNWKLWALATLVAFVIVGPIVATGLYAWWMRRARAGIARTWAYVMMFFIPALLSMGAYIWFVGVLEDALVYAALGLVALLLILASVGSRRRAV